MPPPKITALRVALRPLNRRGGRGEETGGKGEVEKGRKRGDSEEGKEEEIGRMRDGEKGGRRR